MLEYGDWDACDNPLTIDNTPPGTPVLTEALISSDWSSANTPRYEWADVADQVTGVQYYEGLLDSVDTGHIVSGWQPTLPEDGIHGLKIRAVDQLGNEGGWSNTVAVKIDTTPPTGSITINGGDPSTTRRDVTLTLSSGDGGSGLKDMCPSNDGAGWTPWEPFTASRAWQLAEGLGEKTVYVKYRDSLDQEAAYSDTINLEQEPPDFTIKLGAGWNLVSFPVIPADPSVASVMAGITPYTVRMWTGTEYVPPQCS